MSITFKNIVSDKATTWYERCNDCGHQIKKDLAPFEPFSNSPCEQCGSKNQQTYVGSDTDRPSWWKP